MVNQQIDRMAKASGTDTEGLAAKLKSKGVSMSALRTFVTAQVSFNRLLSALYKIDVKVDPSEVDRKYQEIAQDPRLKPVTIYEIIEITLPVEKTSDAMAEQLLIARAADAQQYRNQYKGCASAHQAAAGNVHDSRHVGIKSHWVGEHEASLRIGDCNGHVRRAAGVSEPGRVDQGPTPGDRGNPSRRPAPHHRRQP